MLSKRRRIWKGQKTTGDAGQINVRAVVQDEALLLVFIGQSHRVKEHGPARLEPVSEPRRA